MRTDTCLPGADRPNPPSTRAAILARLRASGGFTLLELLIATSLSLIILGAVTAVLVSATNSQARDTEWAHVLQESRTALTTMVTQLRQAYFVRSDTPSSIEFYATLDNAKWVVLFSCKEPEAGTAFEMCVRKKAEITGTTIPSEAEVAAQKAVPIIEHVLNGTSADEPGGHEDPVFQRYSPSTIAPDLITVKIVMPASGTLKLADAAGLSHHVVLENAAYLRNTAVGV